MLRPGMFLQDRYEILELIGSGGMSDVYKARCHKLNRLVAVKVLKAEFSDDSNFVSKFKMEAQAAAGLSHPNIVNVYDVIDEGRLHYIVMELIEGVTLKNYISKRGVLGVKETVGIAIQVAMGIAVAHEQNIIHRDIKPQNMIISKDGKVKVADFGIARAATSQTLSSTAMGSVHYISPEQARGGYSDARSDIYSLGITMYEMATGRLPFEGDNTVTVALAHLEEPITRPSYYNPSIPPSLENIILKCTEKKPEYRYSSSAELIADLKRVLLNPNDDFVTMAPPEPDYSETITISPRELEVINQGRRQYNKPANKPANKPTANRQSKKPSPQRGRRPAPEEEDVNPKIEKLMTAVGIVAAILIVAILIFVFSKLSGVFNLGSSPSVSSTEAVTTVPAETTLSDTDTYMPNVVNLPEDMAEAKLKDSTLVMKVAGYEDSDTVGKGFVIRQDDKEGSIVPKYSTVNVIVSNGTDVVTLADLSLAGLDVDAAKTLLQSRRLTAVVTEENNDLVEKGKVIRYEPEKARPGEAVNLYVSSGPAAVMKAVPDITKVTTEVADEMLSDSGFVKGDVKEEFSDTVAAGIVISQDTAADTQLAEGSTVSYTVSKGSDNTAKRYVASISETYNLASLIGPGAEASSIQVSIRLKQIVNGQPVYTVLMKPRTLTGQDLLPVNFPSIQGAPGVDTGEVEIVDEGSGAAIKSYPIRFFAME